MSENVEKTNIKYNHYYRDVSHLQVIDVYQILKLFDVTDPCLQHALKKILAAGNRGSKNIDKDVQEAIDTLKRFQDMQEGL
jgi:hypothetical protein